MAKRGRSPWQNLLLAIAATASLVAGYYLGNIASGKKPETQVATLIPEPRQISDFSLVDFNNAPFTLDNLKGKWSLIFFGYTHCPDICPLALNSMAEIHKKLAEKKADLDQLQILFISVDPKRDTPEHMKNYVTFYNPSFLAATGEEAQLRALTAQLAIQYKLHEPDENGEYLVDHSSWLIVVNPEGQFHAVISGSNFPNTQGIADDIALIADI
jgi:protein SCO1/2